MGRNICYCGSSRLCCVVVLVGHALELMSHDSRDIHRTTETLTSHVELGENVLCF